MKKKSKPKIAVQPSKYEELMNSVLLQSTPLSVPEIKEIRESDRKKWLKKWKVMEPEVAKVRAELSKKSTRNKLIKTYVSSNHAVSEVAGLECIIKKMAEEAAETVFKKHAATIAKPAPISEENQMAQDILYRVECILVKKNDSKSKLVEIMKTLESSQKAFKKTPNLYIRNPGQEWEEKDMKELRLAEKEQIEEERQVKKVINFAVKNNLTAVLHHFYPNEILGNKIDLSYLKSFKDIGKKNRKRSKTKR